MSNIQATREEKSKVARMLATALVATVADFGDETPSGPICLGFQQEVGATAAQYMAIENALVQLGVLNRCDGLLSVNVAVAKKLGYWLEEKVN